MIYIDIVVFLVKQKKMFSGLVRMIRFKSLFPLFVFLILLTMTFYYVLMDALHKHKNNPIAIPEHHVKLTPEEARMKAYEKSLIWSFQSKADKMKNLLENPIYEKYNIAKPQEKKKVTILLIVSSGPRRSDRRNAIRETWWKYCKPTDGVCIYVALFKIIVCPGIYCMLLNDCM